jgi:hypothetical protein
MQARIDSAKAAGVVNYVDPSVRLGMIDNAGRFWMAGMFPLPAEKRNVYLLEVIDPKTRQVLASRRLDVFLQFLPGSDLAYSSAEDADGFTTFTVWRLEFR